MTTFDPEQYDFPDDVVRVRDACDQHELFVTYQGAEEIWLAFSRWMDAGWMRLPKKDEDLWRDIHRGVCQLIDSTIRKPSQP